MIVNDKYFYAEQNDTVITLYLDGSIFLENKSFDHKSNLLEYLVTVDENPAIKTLVISNEHPQYRLDQYKADWNSLYESDEYENHLSRVFRIYNQLFLQIKSMQKVVISAFTQPTNVALFNLGMASDLRFASNGYYIDNDNSGMVNIPKGGAAFSKSNLMHMNPVKMLFLSDKVLPEELHKKHFVDEVYSTDELIDKVSEIAKHYAKFDYTEIEAVKIIEHNQLKKVELDLQRENDFLMSCIRKRKNSIKQ